MSKFRYLDYNNGFIFKYLDESRSNEIYSQFINIVFEEIPGLSGDLKYTEVKSLMQSICTTKLQELVSFLERLVLSQNTQNFKSFRKYKDPSNCLSLPYPVKIEDALQYEFIDICAKHSINQIISSILSQITGECVCEYLMKGVDSSIEVALSIILSLYYEENIETQSKEELLLGLAMLRDKMLQALRLSETTTLHYRIWVKDLDTITCWATNDSKHKDTMRVALSNHITVLIKSTKAALASASKAKTKSKAQAEASPKGFQASRLHNRLKDGTVIKNSSNSKRRLDYVQNRYDFFVEWAQQGNTEPPTYQQVIRHFGGSRRELAEYIEVFYAGFKQERQRMQRLEQILKPNPKEEE